MLAALRAGLDQGNGRGRLTAPLQLFNPHGRSRLGWKRRCKMAARLFHGYIEAVKGRVSAFQGIYGPLQGVQAVEAKRCREGQAALL